MASVTKRGSKWYAMWNDALGRPRQKVTPATTKTEAMLFAREKERQAWRQREGLDPLLTERLAFGELMDCVLPATVRRPLRRGARAGNRHSPCAGQSGAREGTRPDRAASGGVAARGS